MIPIVQLKDVTKSYGRLKAVDSVSLEVTEGEFFTLLGPSGCGKTTTLRLIAGLAKPDSGGIYIKGELVNDRPPHIRNLGVVFQHYALFPHMTVYENVAYGLRNRKVGENDVRTKVKNSLGLVGLTGLEDRYPNQLSGGQQQRVALARATVISPNVLLLDEPLSNLDLKLRQKMRRELKVIQRDIGITTIYVTHDQSEALAMSDTIAVMNHGSVIQVGKAQEIYSSPKERFVAEFIGEANMLHGTITELVGESAAILVDGVLSIRIPRTIGMKVGDKTTISLRPEKVTISRIETEPMMGGFTQVGALTSIEYLGSFTRYFVKLDCGVDIVSDAQNIQVSSGNVIGDKVAVHWESTAMTIVSGSQNE